MKFRGFCFLRYLLDVFIYNIEDVNIDFVYIRYFVIEVYV